MAEIPLCHVAVDPHAVCDIHLAQPDLDARRLQQRVPAHRRAARGPHPRARHARHPLHPARPARPRDGHHRGRAAVRAAARLLHDEASLRG